MSDNTAMVISLLIFWGWIPILALGKAISMIVSANKSKNNIK